MLLGSHPALEPGAKERRPFLRLQEWVGTAAGSHLLWMNVGKGGHANKYIKIRCGRPFLFQSGLQGGV